MVNPATNVNTNMPMEQMGLISPEQEKKFFALTQESILLASSCGEGYINSLVSKRNSTDVSKIESVGSSDMANQAAPLIMPSAESISALPMQIALTGPNSPNTFMSHRVANQNGSDEANMQLVNSAK